MGHRDAPGTDRSTINSPLTSTVLVHVGPAPVTEALVVTWAIMAILVAGSALLTHRL